MHDDIKNKKINNLNNRFRGFYPVVIDIETSGVNYKKNALLEIAIITLKMDNYGWIKKDKILHYHIKPFIGSIIEKKSLEFNKIDPYSPFRKAINEHNALKYIFNFINKEIKNKKFKKAILVAHNVIFDLNFINAAVKRSEIIDNPFHNFVTFDTAALSGLVFGQTVLAKACKAIGMNFDINQAHSALYDVIKTAKLFCFIVNYWKKLGGWPVKNNELLIK